jgi:hypothetical protein
MIGIREKSHYFDKNDEDHNQAWLGKLQLKAKEHRQKLILSNQSFL